MVIFTALFGGHDVLNFGYRSDKMEATSRHGHS